MTQIPGSLGLLHQVQQSRKHLCASAGFKALDKTARGGNILCGGSQWLGGEFIIEIIEGDDAEAIVGAEAVERLEKSLSRLRDGRAGHRPGNVNQVEHFYGQAFRGLNGGRERS